MEAKESPIILRVLDSTEEETGNTTNNSFNFENSFLVDTSGTFMLEDEIEYDDKDVVKLESSQNVQSPDGGNRVEGGRQNNSVCWNCDENNHSMMNCPHRRNVDHILLNKMLFYFGKRKRESNQSKIGPQRYHDKGNLRDQYPHVKPGRISDSLRRALGLATNQLPRHIYNLRRHGYPKNYLKEAIDLKTRLDIFDSSGKSVCHFPGLEDGEVLENSADVATYDFDKLIAYPGFNVEASSNIVDEHSYYGEPAFNPGQSLENMMNDLNKKEEQVEREAVLEVEPEIKQTEEKVLDETPRKSYGEVVSESTTTVFTGTQQCTSRLPSLDKFSAGLSDILYADNSAEYIGTYENKLQHLLSRSGKKSKK